MSLPQVLIKDKYCLTIDEAVAYFNIGEKRMRKIVEDIGFHHTEWCKNIDQAKKV